VPHQVPAAGFETAVADIDDIVTGGDRRARWDEGFEPNQQRLAAAGIADPRHVVVGCDHVTGRHTPPLAEKIREIQLRRLAAVTRIDPDQARGTTFDRGEQHLASAGGARDRGQSAQPGFRMAGIAVRVNQAPIRSRPVDPLVDVLTHCGVKAAVALGKAADPEVTAAT
jgi:hypothetical protein